jgi:hypothetical protein
MTKKAEFVQLEAGEDVASVRDRLSFIRGQRVLVIWPEDGTALTRKLDLVLIQREAMRRAIRVALVTHDPQIIQYASELNISTFETIGASERGRWKRGRGKVFANRFQKPKDEPEPDELMEVASRVRLPGGGAISKVRRFIVRTLVLALLVGAIGGAAYALIPGAIIIINPAQTRVAVEEEIVADPQAADVDIENGIIPATILRTEIEATGTVETTGTRDLADVAATGSVVFINQTNRAVNIPARTTISTSTGTPILFRTTEDAVLDAGVGQQLEVPIEALSGTLGPGGNVESGLINTVVGPLEASVTVRNIAPTSGGENRAMPAVTDEDHERLLGVVRQQLQAQAYTAMQAQVSATQFVVIETLRIVEEREDWMSFSAQPGDIIDTLSLNMRAVVEAVAVDQQFAQQIILAAMSREKPRGREIKPETLNYECCPVVDVSRDGHITLKISGSGLVAGQVNVGQLQERLAGRSTEEALHYLSTEVDLADGSTPQIVVSPDWIGRLPILPIRIDIRLHDSS